MKHSITLIACVLSYFILFNSGCVISQKVVQMEPDEQENIFWYRGQAIAEKKQDSIIVRAAFTEANRKFLVFDVEVFNEQTGPILVTPEVFLLNTPAGPRQPGTNPETRILLLKRGSASEEEGSSTSSTGSVLMSDELYFWEELALRRTTLRPGEQIRGLVAFPRMDDAEGLRLETPIEQENFVFLFTQRVYQP